MSNDRIASPVGIMEPLIGEASGASSVTSDGAADERSHFSGRKRKATLNSTREPLGGEASVASHSRVRSLSPRRKQRKRKVSPTSTRKSVCGQALVASHSRVDDGAASVRSRSPRRKLRNRKDPPVSITEPFCGEESVTFHSGVGGSTDEPYLHERQRAKRKQKLPTIRQSKSKAFVRNRIISSEESEDVSDGDGDGGQNSLVSGGRRQLVSKRKWSYEELRLLKSEFASFLKTDALPGWSDIDQLKRQFPCFCDRSKETIKARFVHFKKTGR